MRSDLQHVSLWQLREDYFGVTRYVPRVEQLVHDIAAGTSRRSLDRLLRHHSEEAVSDQETWWRDGLDYLLALYGAIEIGIWTGDLPADLPEEFAERARSVLFHPAVRRYHEEHYALVLPSLLCSRLRGAPKIRAGSLRDPGRFAIFLEVTRPIEHDSDLETFLWYLDGGWRGSDIGDTKHVLRSRERFLRAMASRPDARTPLERSVVGFAKFLTFSRAFERLLDGTAERPTLAAGFWYYHAYWFARSAARLRRHMDSGIACFAAWAGARDDVAIKSPTSGTPTSAGAPAEDSSKGYAEDRERMRRTIARLTSGDFGIPLHALLDPALVARLDPSYARDTL